MWIEKLQSTSLDQLTADLRLRYAPFVNLDRVAVVGAAAEGRKFLSFTTAKVIAIADEDKTQQGYTLRGVRVTRLADLFSIDKNVPVVIASHRTLSVTKRLKKQGFKNIAPLGLLQTLGLAPPHPFYAGILEDLIADLPKYQVLWKYLRDDKSRDTLDAILGYRMTFDPEILAPVVDGNLYDPGLWSNETDEVYIDGGAYDGDSVAAFIARTADRFSVIVAFEPDKSNFIRLRTRFGKHPRIRLVNVGLGETATQTGFSFADRNSHCEDGGLDSVQLVRLDSVLGLRRVTLIKLNIEGMEIEALEGAKILIRKHVPKLAISAYHRPSDLWQVPAKILDLVPDYKLYLRQHDGGIVETVCYAL